MKNCHVVISDMYCTRCGEKNIPIPRTLGKKREQGHLKKLYCTKCRMETNSVEVTATGRYTVEDFREEFEAGRFVDGERVPASKLTKCTNNNCKYNHSGLCWNANCSYDCGYRIIKEESLRLCLI